AKEDREAPEEEELPELKEGLTSFSFTLKDPVTIPSDNQSHRVFLTSKIVDKAQKEGLLNYHAIPKLSQYVYLNSVFPNPFDFPIFMGKLNVYLDGRFVSSEQLNKTYTPNEDMLIPLGIDESIKIERKRVKKFTEYTGIVSKTEKIVYEYEITIKNGKTRDIALVVKDNYPVSLNEQIKVQLEAPSEKEAEISKDGIITWKIKIEPKATKKLTLKFNIEYPKGLRISGVE
ncbi:MAG: DUF4139 domain-containing protein, partial [Thermodesulfovibrionales bacterium]|nr:DUF4139 domain-containing protein [Thermodesulfovibrionales bacterium]